MLFEFRYFFLLYLFNCKLYLKSYLFLFVYLKQHLNLVFKTNSQNFTGTQKHVNAFIKKFKITSTRYRNRRKNFKLYMSLICGIYNFETANL